jgi:hypothetical protein
MLSTKRRFDLASFIVIAVTFFLFLAALFTKGITHDLFLEAGVLLVSIKVIMMQSNLSSAVKLMEERLGQIQFLLERAQNR